MSYSQRILEQQQKQTTQTESSKQFNDCEFWIWDKVFHEQEYDRTKGKCCFNHAIGLPVKNDQPRPIYQWQKEIVEALDNNHHKLLAILKGRSIGGSEVLLRWILYLCLRDNKMQDKDIAIVTGIREQLSLDLLSRLKKMADNVVHVLDYETKESEAVVNKCRVRSYPSRNAVKDLRGSLAKFVLLDEADWYEKSDSEQILQVLEALRAKTDCQIVLLSTPSHMGSLMYNLYQEPESTCRYKRLYIPVTKAVGTLISEQEAAEIKLQPNHRQEFLLEWNSGYGQGNCFSITDLQACIENAKQLIMSTTTTTNYQQHSSYPQTIYPEAKAYKIGLDIGFGDSASAVVLVQLFDNKIHVQTARQFTRSNQDEVIAFVYDLYKQTNMKAHIFVDASSPSAIRKLKHLMHESVSYEYDLERIRKHNWQGGVNEVNLPRYMSCVPVSFNKHGQRLLQNLATAVQRHWLAISPVHEELISQLQAARTKDAATTPWQLDKTNSSLDLVDALRLCMYDLVVTSNTTTTTTTITEPAT
jgi:Phage terminase large subunit (GpA)